MDRPCSDFIGMNVWVMTSERNLEVCRTLALRILELGENVYDG